MMTDLAIAIIPVVIAAGLTGIGWLIRVSVKSITDDIAKLEAAFTRVSGALAAEHARTDEKLMGVDRRVTRLESWRELYLLHPTGGGD